MKIPPYCCAYCPSQYIPQPSTSLIPSLHHNLHALSIIKIEIIASFHKQAKWVIIHNLIMYFNPLGMNIFNQYLW